LAGIGKLIIVDDEDVSAEDLGAGSSSEMKMLAKR